MATPTKIINDVAPKPGKNKFEKIVILAKKRPPKTPKRVNTCFKYLTVIKPGRLSTILQPASFNFSAISIGFKIILEYKILKDKIKPKKSIKPKTEFPKSNLFKKT